MITFTTTTPQASTHDRPPPIPPFPLERPARHGARPRNARVPAGADSGGEGLHLPVAADAASDEVAEIGDWETMNHATLKIYPEFSLDDGDYVLMCSDGRMSPGPCGPRIFRGPPHPRVKFRHATQQEAETDAELIRKYLAALPKREPTKKEMQREGA